VAPPPPWVAVKADESNSVTVGEWVQTVVGRVGELLPEMRGSDLVAVAGGLATLGASLTEQWREAYVRQAE